MSTALLALVVILTLMLLVVILGVYNKNTNGICKSRKRLDGKTTVITGGTTGMGLEYAIDFAARGARVIIACPFQAEGTDARKTIVETTGNENVVFKLLDLGSLDSVRKFAADIVKTEERLDILMNNAGVGIPGDFLTADGMNFIMQVNYFGHFLLTLLLLPILKKTGKSSEPSRIVNTSSVLHRIGKVEIEKLNITNYWYIIQIYGNSKLCLILFSRELTKRLKGANIVTNNLDPGAVGTAIFQSATKLCGQFVSFTFRYLAKNPYEGAQSGLHAALDDDAGKVSGELFKDCKLHPAVRSAYDDKLASKLWEESVRLVKLSDVELEQCFKV